MRFEKILPIDKLKPYVKYLVLSENSNEQTYKVFPSTGLVVGFQYKGNLTFVENNKEILLATSGITGLQDRFKVFKNSTDIATILVYFTETGITHFLSNPVNELFNQSISLDYLFDKTSITQIEEELAFAKTDKIRIKLIERFLLSQIKDIQEDKLVLEAVRLIYQSKGTIRIKELNAKLSISKSPFEKRFRKTVGTSAKKFASIVRFNSTLSDLEFNKSIAEICYENNFFDQAHFIKDFKQYTGDTPENFKHLL